MGKEKPRFEKAVISLSFSESAECKAHTASLIASDLKGTEEPDGAFGGGGPPRKLAIPNRGFNPEGIAQ